MLYSARKLRILPLVQAIHLVAVGSTLFMTMPAAYAAVAAVADKSQHYQIAAGSLTQVLNQFAIQSGALFAANASLTDGLQSKGLAGNYTPVQGFNALLLPHGLQVINKNGTYQVIAVAKLKNTEATAPQNEKQSAVENKTGSLPLITLKATKKDGYTSKRSNTATKFDLSLKETPQSVSVITQQRIQDQQLTSLTDVLNQTVGVSTKRYGTDGSNAGGTEFFARAGSIENFQIDGVPTSAYDVINGTYDTLGYESVTVLRGSAGLLNGAGYPSASVNLQRKHAKDEFYASGSLSASRWNTYRAQVDVSDALNVDKSVRGYFSGSYQQGDSFRNYTSSQHAALYGIIDADISDHSVLNIGIDAFDAEYKGGGQRSVGVDFNNNPNSSVTVDRKFNSSARWSNSQETRYNLFATYTTNFENGWKTVANLNYINRDAKHIFGIIGNWEMYQQIDGKRIGNFFAGRHDFKIQQASFDLSAQGPYQLFGREHELMLGVGTSRYKNTGPEHDWYYNDLVFDKKTGEYVSGGLDLDTWTGNIAKPDVWNVLWQNSEDIKQSGIYLATRLKPTDRLSVILGSRFANYQQNSSYLWGTSRIRERNVWVPYAGLVFDLNDIFSLYGSYTSIFKPQDYRDRNGDPLDPLQGNTYELGLKSSWNDDKLNASIALFQADQDDYAVQDGNLKVPNSLDDAYKNINGVTTKGFELELTGEILPRWNLSTGYTYAKLTDVEKKRIGQDIPLATYKLFTTYQLPNLEKLTFGGGVAWQSKTSGDWSNSVQDGYTLLNLFARYQLTPKLQLQMNATNITDETYRMNIGQHAYGEPANVKFTANYKY